MHTYTGDTPKEAFIFYLNGVSFFPPAAFIFFRIHTLDTSGDTPTDYRGFHFFPLARFLFPRPRLSFFSAYNYPRHTEYNQEGLMFPYLSRISFFPASRTTSTTILFTVTETVCRHAGGRHGPKGESYSTRTPRTAQQLAEFRRHNHTSAWRTAQTQRAYVQINPLGEEQTQPHLSMEDGTDPEGLRSNQSIGRRTNRDYLHTIKNEGGELFFKEG